MRHHLDRPRPWRMAAVLGFALALPTLWVGLQVDDHLLRANLARDPAWEVLRTAPWDAFHFFPGERTSILDHALAPWWAAPGMRARMLRPLASLGHWGDLRLWPGQPWLMHLHSILWYAALCAVAAALYRRLLAGWAAGLAALLYAVDFTHGVPVGWISNRNGLIAATAGLAAVLLHARARADRSRGAGLGAAGLAAPVALAAGLAAGESALGAVGYLVAYAACVERGAWTARARTLAPYGAVVAVWLVTFLVGDLGAAASGLYLDPLASPAAFLRALPTRATLLLASELGGPGPDLLIILPPAGRAAFVGVGAGVVALAAVALAPLLRRDPVARFLALGALLAVVPTCAAFPAARLMLLPGFGLVGLAARLFAAWRDRDPALPTGGPRRAATATFAGLAFVAHAVASPPLFVFGGQQMGIVERHVTRLSRGVPDAPSLRGEWVVLVNPPDSLLTMYLLPQRSTRGRPLPAGAFLLGLGTHTLELERAGPASLVVRDAGGFYGEGFSSLTRPADLPMPEGSQVVLTACTIEVTATSRGVPTEIVARFAWPLEDPRLRWLAWDGATLAPFTPPAPGRSVTLPGRRNPMLP